MCKLYKNVLFCILTFLMIHSSFSQNIDSIFLRKADSLLLEKNTSYLAMKSSLFQATKDSVKAQYLIKYYADNNYAEGESYALNAIGIYYRDTSQYDEALEYHNKGLEKAKEAANIELRVHSLNMLGVVYRRMDAASNALDYHQEALALAEKVENPSESIRRSIAVSLNSMGNIFLLLKQYDLAIERFTKSLAIEGSVGNTLGLAINHHNIGYAKEATGDLEGALKGYLTSLEYNDKINSDLGRVICNNSIGQIYVKQKRFQEAIDIISSTLQKAKDLRDKFHLSGVYNNLGWAYLEMNNYKLARKYLNEGLATSEEFDLKSSVAEAYQHLSTLSEKEGKYQESLTYYKKAQKLNNEITDERKFKYVNDLIMKYDAKKINTMVEDLKEENETVRQTLQRNKNIWITSSIVLAFLAIMIYILYRQRLLHNQKKILTLEQDMLRSQMNPHFVFNSLNSIKQYIISNEQKNAVHYLNKFAKLIRKILDASRVKEVSLGDELDTMDLYMSIENIRFSNEINFEILVDDTIDLENVKIPSLVLQPFLENALWHGLSSKKGEKNIQLSVTDDHKDFVTISITDNGIGRKEAQRIAEKKIVKRKSVGIALTKNRLANFVKDFKNSFSLRFNDLKDTDETPLGTQVVLEIPLR